MSHEREAVIWAAGLFEGEGNVRGRSGKRGDQLMLRVGMNDVACLMRLCDALGGRVHEVATDARATATHYYWIATGRTAYAAGVALWPFLIGEKRDQLGGSLRRWRDRRPRASSGHRARTARVVYEGRA